MKKYISIMKQNKKLSLFIVLVVVLGIFFTYRSVKGKTTDVSYITSSPQKGTLTISISGTGAVSATNQVDLKSKVSGNILDVKVKNGSEVKSGDVIVVLDAGDANKSIRDAYSNLQSAQLSLEKLKAPADSLTILQSENSLKQANKKYSPQRLHLP